MTTGITIRGADRLARTTAAAADDIERLTAVNRKVADGIKAAANPPRRSGRLAGSLTAEATAGEATVSSGLVYAGVIEHGWAAHGISATNFLTEAARAKESASVKLYSDAVDDALKGVKGA